MAGTYNIVRYVTVGGAEVEVTRETQHADRYAARCTGCNWAANFTRSLHNAYGTGMHDVANDHATNCRAKSSQ